MPIPNYSVLKGLPSGGKVVKGASTHYQITLEANGESFTVAVNIQSTDGSEVLYVIEESFTPPDPAALTALAAGVTPLKSAPGGLALDFVREQINGRPMVTREQMTLLPSAGPREAARAFRATPLSNAVDQLLDKAVADGSTIFAFGSSFADKGRTDGIHNIHMNQGNPSGQFQRDNGTWQDGALFLLSPEAETWTAVFIAFQTESWNTDAAGDATDA